MKKVMSAVNNNLEEVICAFLLSTVIVLMGFQVFGRYVFGYVSPVCEEVSRWAFVWLIYFGAAMGAKRGRHFRVSVYKLIFKGRADTVVTIFGDCIWLGFNLFMVIIGLQFVNSVIQQQYLSPALMFPMKYIYPIIPLGFLLIAVRMITFSIKNIFYTRQTTNHVHH
ncbi:MAG: TRAP transporter small permease [Deltaproteobacteria bacterium]|nr:TRAP transporter small permease [Deltaproteobacteria bacterium]